MWKKWQNADRDMHVSAIKKSRFNNYAAEDTCPVGKIPSSVGEISTYTLRNQHNIFVPFCRTEISRKSCILSSVSELNSLDIELRNSPSLARLSIN